jgi:hypothetical protein
LRGSSKICFALLFHPIRRGYIFPFMSDAAHALTQQFLAWVAEAPRSYAEADAWRRSCPHLSRIVLTARGRRQLGGS